MLERAPQLVWQLVRSILVVTLLLTAIAPTTVRAASPADEIPEIDAYVERLLAYYDVPGAAIGLVQDGEVVYLRGYGVRDTITNEPVDADTRFAIGSVTKSFTGLLVAQLAAEGRLELDAPVIEYFPWFQLMDETATQTVTVRQATSHQTGLPRDDRWYGRELSRREIIEEMRLTEPTARPGELFQYNNQNFVLAGYLVGELTGSTWEVQVRKRIFEPLGMTESGVAVPELAAAPNHASPHWLDIFAGQIPLPFTSPGLLALDYVGPTGSINSTVRDMVRYLQMRLNEGVIDGQRVFTAEAIREAQQPYIGMEATPGDIVTDRGYGFGVVVENYRDHRLVYHDGGIDGYTAIMAMLPDERSGLVVLTNGNQAHAFIYAVRAHLLDWLLGLEPDRDYAAHYNRAFNRDPEALRARIEAARYYQPDPAMLERLVGEYETELGVFPITLEDGRLILHSVDPGDLELVPFADGEFLANGSLITGSVFTFLPDKSGGIVVLLDGMVIGHKSSQGAS